MSTIKVYLSKMTYYIVSNSYGYQHRPCTQWYLVAKCQLACIAWDYYKNVVETSLLTASVQTIQAFVTDSIEEQTTVKTV